MALTAERLRELLAYDRDTGVFTWRMPRGGKVKTSGHVAGWIEKGPYNGYVRIEVDGKAYLAHRLAVFYVTGEWPKGRVDHKDTDPTNNRYDNLRATTPSLNAANRGCSTNNTSGFKGVSLYKPTGRWVAHIRHNYHLKHLGYFGTPEEAHAAYCTAAHRLFGEFAKTE